MRPHASMFAAGWCLNGAPLSGAPRKNCSVKNRKPAPLRRERTNGGIESAHSSAQRVELVASPHARRKLVAKMYPGAALSFARHATGARPASMSARDAYSRRLCLRSRCDEPRSSTNWSLYGISGAVQHDSPCVASSAPRAHARRSASARRSRGSSPASRARDVRAHERGRVGDRRLRADPSSRTRRRARPRRSRCRPAAAASAANLPSRPPADAHQRAVSLRRRALICGRRRRSRAVLADHGGRRQAPRRARRRADRPRVTANQWSRSPAARVRRPQPRAGSPTASS